MRDRLCKLLRQNPPILSDEGLLSGSGASVPSAAYGWQPGALFQDTTNGVLYVNEGTLASCSFKAVAAGLGSEDFDVGGDLTVGGDLSVDEGVIAMGAQDDATPLSTAKPFAVEVQSAVAADVVAGATGLTAGVYSRYEVAADQTSQCSHVSIVGKLRVKKDLADGAHGGLLGYVEISGSGTVIGGTASTTTSAVQAAVEADANFELSTGHLCGVLVDSSVNSGATISGTMSGIRVKKSGSSLAWPTGILFDDSSCTTAIDVGICTTGLAITGATGRAIDVQTSGVVRLGVQGTGIPVSTSYPFGLEVHTKSAADISGGDVGASAGIYVRNEIGADMTTQCSHIGIFSKLRVKKDLADGAHAALYGYLEISESDTVIGGTATTSTAAVRAAIEADSNFELSTGYLSGVEIDSSVNDSATISGTMSAIRIKTSAGKKVWTNGVLLDECTNLMSLPAAGTDPVIANELVPAGAPDAGTVGADACLRVLVNNVAYYVALYDTLHG